MTMIRTGKPLLDCGDVANASAVNCRQVSASRA